jgi:hypothetical protein
MIAFIIGAILMIISVAVSLYQITHPSAQAPEAIAYEYWWMSLPM